MTHFFETIFGKILRVLAVIPAAFLSLILVSLLINLFMYLSGPYGTDETILASIIRPLLATGIGSWSFVYFGSYVAPFYKRAVCVLLCIILMILYVLLFIGILNYDLLWSDGIGEGWMFILSGLVLIVGSIIGVSQVWEEEHK
tara:strand:+ start:391 stop:819 length:429 start_codon:yes stop_codon:yes gene_type:complete